MSGPIYTYTSNTPQGSQPFNQSQSEILNNFQAIAELVAVNHGAFNNTTNFGKHLFVSMPNQTSVPTTGSQEIAMYTQVTGSPNPCEIFIQYPNNGVSGGITVSPIQISNIPINTGGSGTSAGNASQGNCIFPSGIMLRWGTFSAAGNTQQNINWTLNPLYQSAQIPAAVNPLSSGCEQPTGIYVYSGAGSGVPVTLTPVAFYGYTSVSIVTQFNYFCIGI